MATTEKSIEVLNDLIQINNDRVAGFEKSISELEDQDGDLKSLFMDYSEQSRKNAQELTSTVAQAGGEADNSTTTGGAIHRAWIDVKSVFTGNDRRSVLEEAERGEDALKKAYKKALDPENELSYEFRDILSRQAAEQKAAHDRVKALRDSQ